MYDNFSVANGQNPAAVTSKRAIDLRSAAERLLARLTQDHVLLCRDYTFSVKPSRPRAGGGALAGLRLAEPPRGARDFFPDLCGIIVSTKSRIRSVACGRSLRWTVL